MVYKTFTELVTHIRKSTGKRIFAVAAAGTEHAIEAALEAKAQGVGDPIFCGDEAAIRRIRVELGRPDDDSIIINCVTPEDSARAAIDCVKEKKADFLMKGLIETSALMKLALNSNDGIKSGSVVHAVSFMEVETHHKLIVGTDSAITIAPDIGQKKDMINNTVAVMRRMGWECPMVALLAAVEKVSPKMQATLDAAQLKEMWRNGEMPGCVVDGPMAFDLAINRESAEIKGYVSKVAGEADLLIYPEITSANIGIKTITMTGHNISGTVILGLQAPLVMTSRGSSMENKLRGIMLSAAMAT